MLKYMKDIIGFYKNLFEKLIESKDEYEIKKYETDLIGGILSPMLIFAAVANIMIGYIWDVDKYSRALFFVVLFIISLLLIFVINFEFSYRIKININSALLLIATFTTFIIYYDYLKTLFWIILLIITLSVSFGLDRTPMFYMMIGDISIFIYIRFVYGDEIIILDRAYNIVLFILVMLFIITSFVVNYVYHLVIGKKNEQYMEISGQNEEISALYEEIIASEDVLKEQNDQLIELNKEITENKERLEFLAYNDTLTGLPNRKMIYEQLDMLIDINEEKNGHFALVFIDIDNFKRINDSMGHSSGDDLLVQVAERCSKLVNKKDLFGRLGGDELALVVRRGLSDEDLFEYIQSICSLFEETFELDLVQIRITASFGIAIWPNDGTTVSSLLKAADTAMYKAKEVGKNTVQFYRKEMKSEILSKIEMENKMMTALEKNQFYMAYQPLFNTLTQEVVAFEALIRWNIPEYGNISPAEFIPFAEENGFIHQIGEWVIREVCNKIKNIKEYYNKEFRIAINVSAIQLKNHGFIDKMLSIIEENGVTPDDIEIEITESVFIQDKKEAIDDLNRLKEYGFKISMDDFGTGYSSLSYLLELPIDKLKIDKSFIDTLNTDTRKSEIVGSIVDMVHNLKIQVVAEGVESENQLEYLKEKDCDIVQGYLLGRPLDNKEVEKLLLKSMHK